MSRQTFGIGVAALLVLGGAGAWAFQNGAEGSAEVEAGEIHERIISRAVVVPVAGTAEVRPRIDGRVLRVHVREGQYVKAGDRLAEIEPTILAAEVTRRRAEQRSLESTAAVVAAGARPEERRAIEAELEGAEAELALARKQAARVEELAKSGAVAVSQLDDAKSAASIAEARVLGLKQRLAMAKAGGRPDEVRAARASSAAAAAAVELAERQLDETKLVAPIDGVVLTRRVDPGDTITGAAAVLLPAAFELADDAHKELRVEVEEGDALRIAPGMAVEVRVPGQGELLGRSTIDRVGAQLTRRTIGAYDASERGEGWVRSAWVSWKEGDRALPLGQRLEVTIALPAKHVEARVPRGAIRVTDGYAEVETSGGLLGQRVRVELGAADASHVEVRGVSKGARVRVAR